VEAGAAGHHCLLPREISTLQDDKLIFEADPGRHAIQMGLPVSIRNILQHPNVTSLLVMEFVPLELILYR
jgi:hypothetical protein